jgi:hypothetical protein
VRAGIAMSLFDEERRNDQKHCGAITDVVGLIKKSYPDNRISNTGVRRILAEFRPKERHTVLLFERTALTGEELEKFHWKQKILAALRHDDKSTLPTYPKLDRTEPVTVFRIRFGERPNYPRHNRKRPKE